MPHNNRMSTSATLKTSAIWQNAIGHDPYANAEEKQTTSVNTEADAAKVKSVMEMARTQNVTDGASRDDFTAKMYMGLKPGKQRRGDGQRTSQAMDPRLQGLLEVPSSSSEEDFVQVEQQEVKKKTIKDKKKKHRKRKKHSSSSSSDDDSSSDESSHRERKRRREKRKKRKHRSRRSNDVDDSDDDSDRDRKRKRKDKRHRDDKDDRKRRSRKIKDPDRETGERGEKSSGRERER